MAMLKTNKTKFSLSFGKKQYCLSYFESFYPYLHYVQRGAL